MGGAVVSWLLLPLVLAALCLGCGLLAEQLSGARLPGALLVPLGLAVTMVAAGLTTAWSATAPLAWLLVVVLAVSGVLLSRRRPRRVDPWAVGTALAVYGAYSAPFLLSGENTFGGYIKLDDTATWLNIVDHVMAHGRDLSGLAPSSYQANLAFYLGTTGYPLGSFTPLGVGRTLVGQDAAWLFQPYLSLLAATLSLGLYALARPIVRSRPLTAVAAFLAAQPALLFAFAMWGGIKELASAPLVALLAALAPRLAAGMGRLREAIPAAVAVAALLAVLGPGAAPWLLPLLVGALAGIVWLRRRRVSLAATARQVAAFAVIAAVLAIPTWLLTGAFLKGGGPLYTGGGLFNLFKPLSPLQIVGIWPSADFRVDPSGAAAALLAPLIGIAVGAAALGVAWSLRRRDAGVPIYLVGAGLGCAIVAAVSSPWITAKGVATASPAVVLAACAGAGGAGRLRRGLRRLLGPLALALIAIGVLWSNVAAYTQVTLAPHDRLSELERLAPRVAGHGPTLVTEPEIYADRHFLRAADPEGASDLRPRPVALSGGQTLVRQAWADLDSFAPAAFVPYRTVIVRRSPVVSRPPFPFRMTWRGHWYEAWERPSTGSSTGRHVEHVGLGDKFARPYCGQARTATGEVYRAPCGVRPAAVPACRQVRELGASARKIRGRLIAVPRENPAVLEPRSLRLPPAWDFYSGSGLVGAHGPGVATGVIVVPRAGRYEAWLGGSFTRALEVVVDGRPVGSVQNELSNNGQYVHVGAALLEPGPHAVALRYGDAGPGPGSAEERLVSIGPVVLEPAGAADVPAIAVPASDARSLCGRSLDWIAVVAPR